jgi:hypothetical protein
MSWLDSSNNPIVFSNPTMDIRQELSPTGQILARLDSSGTRDGLISLPQPGTMLLQIASSVTTQLQTGYGFWDLFVIVNNQRVRFAFGTVSITPHVTVPS